MLSTKLSRMESSHFEWQAWRAGTPHTLNLHARNGGFLTPEAMGVLRQHAVGYCEAERIPCRPKLGQVAVMFFAHGAHFWFHMRGHEFAAVFD